MSLTPYNDPLAEKSGTPSSNATGWLVIGLLMSLSALALAGFEIYSLHSRISVAERDSARAQKDSEQARQAAEKRIIDAHLPTGKATITASPNSELIQKLTGENLRLTQLTKDLSDRKQLFAEENTLLRQKLPPGVFVPVLTALPASANPAATNAAAVGNIAGGTASPGTSVTPLASTPNPSTPTTTHPTDTGTPPVKPSIVASPNVSYGESLRMGIPPMQNGIFGPVSPVRTATLAQKPTLHWNPLGRAASYAIKIEEANPPSHTICIEKAESAYLRVPVVLERGKSYRWYVRALNGDGSLIVQSSPAYFAVAPGSSAQNAADAGERYAKMLRDLHCDEAADTVLDQIGGAADR